MTDEQKPKKTKRLTKAQLLQNAAQAVLDVVEKARDAGAHARDVYDEGVEAINAAIAIAVAENEKILDELQGKINEARTNYENATGDYDGLRQEIEDKLQELRDVREENYQNWYDNMPESLQNSPTGEKLSALLEIDLEPEVVELQEFEEPDLPDFEVEPMTDFDEPDLDPVESAAQEILDAELPMGFGKD